jgi:hypothetical protein
MTLGKYAAIAASVITRKDPAAALHTATTALEENFAKHLAKLLPNLAAKLIKKLKETKEAEKIPPGTVPGEVPGVSAGSSIGTGFLGKSGHEFKNLPSQKIRNSSTLINKREYSGHALDQMQNRGIPPSVVENTIRVGESFSTRAGTRGYYDSINNLRVIINNANGKVVTVVRGKP